MSSFNTFKEEDKLAKKLTYTPQYQKEEKEQT
jgi:hypothetical protein